MVRREEAIKMLTAKVECMLRETSGSVEECNSHRCGECNLCYEQGNMGEQVEYLQMAIEALEEPQWIPCSERLPEEKDAGILKKLGTSKRSNHVLITVDVKGDRMTDVGCTYDGVWHWDKKYAFPDWKVLAWMPSPEPWKGDAE